MTEYYLYVPIFEMALGRRWAIRPQRPLKPEVVKQGGPESVDFVMYKKPGANASSGSALALELKFSKSERRFPDAYLNDCLKLGKLMPSTVRLTKFEDFHCFFMIAGKRAHINSLVATPVKGKLKAKLVQQLDMILKQETGERTNQGWYYDSGPEQSSPGCYRVAVMTRQTWWKAEG